MFLQSCKSGLQVCTVPKVPILMSLKEMVDIKYRTEKYTASKMLLLLLKK